MKRYGNKDKEIISSPRRRGDGIEMSGKNTLKMHHFNSTFIRICRNLCVCEPAKRQVGKGQQKEVCSL